MLVIDLTRERSAARFGWVTLAELTPDEERQIRELLQALDVVPEWLTLTSSLQPRLVPGSDLAYDDGRAHPYEVSYAAWAAMLAAVSHLACLRDSLFRWTGPDRVNAKIHTHGPFSLVRGALENASRVVWMLEPNDSDERLLRRLELEWKESGAQDAVRQLMGSPVKSKADRLEELVDLLPPATTDPDEIKLKQKAIKANPGYATIVEADGKYLRSGSSPPKLVWQACSALAHGDYRGTLSYSDREVLAGQSPGIMLALITANVLLLTRGTQLAIETMQVAWRLYNRRAS